MIQASILLQPRGTMAVNFGLFRRNPG